MEVPNGFAVAPLVVGAETAKSELGPYAALLGVQGYEARATYVPSLLAGTYRTSWVFEYPPVEGLSYDSSRRFWEGSHGRAVERSVEELVSLVREETELRRSATRVLGLANRNAVGFAVDVSAMDRDLMSVVLRAFIECDVPDLIVDFFYAEGAFSRDLKGSEGKVSVNRPITGFEGWSDNPGKPLVAIIGAGFEGTLALAAIETLEPSRTVLVIPRGTDGRFDEECERRNIVLLSGPDIEPEYYEVAQPFGTYRALRASVASLLSTSRVVVVPLGPKPFALAALLVASEFRDVAVWRVSAGELRAPQDRMASGLVAGLRMRISNRG